MLNKNVKTRRKNSYCNNCNIYGHIYKECHFPITSYGLICYKVENNIIKFLLLRRRNSYAYIDFIKGLRTNIVSNTDYLKYLFEHMTEEEHELLKNNSDNFDFLWNKLWLYNVDKHLWEYNDCKKGFEIFDLKYYLNNIFPKYKEAEWGFSKGRRNNKEEDIDTAIREFNEETNININNVEIVFDKGFEENFISFTNIRYKSIYYVCKYNNKEELDLSINKNKIEQVCEIDLIKWMTYEEAMNSIRDYYPNKKKILEILNKKIQRLEKIYKKNENQNN